MFQLEDVVEFGRHVGFDASKFFGALVAGDNQVYFAAGGAPCEDNFGVPESMSATVGVDCTSGGIEMINALGQSIAASPDAHLDTHNPFYRLVELMKATPPNPGAIQAEELHLAKELGFLKGDLSALMFPGDKLVMMDDGRIILDRADPKMQDVVLRDCDGNKDTDKLTMFKPGVCHGPDCPQPAETPKVEQTIEAVPVVPPGTPTVATYECPDGTLMTIPVVDSKDAAIALLEHNPGTRAVWYQDAEGVIHRVTLDAQGEPCDIVERLTHTPHRDGTIRGNELAVYADAHGFFRVERQAITIDADGHWHYALTTEQETARTLDMYRTLNVGLDPAHWDALMALPTPPVFNDPTATIAQCAAALLEEARANGIPLDEAAARNLAALIREGQNGGTPGMVFNNSGTVAGEAYDDIAVQDAGGQRSLKDVMTDVARNGVVAERRIAGAGH